MPCQENGSQNVIIMAYSSPVAGWGSGGEFEGNPWGLMGSPQSLFIAQRILVTNLVCSHGGEYRLHHWRCLRFPSRPERFILLSAAQTAEHGNGGTGDVFSGSWVKPKWSADAHRAISAHDMGTCLFVSCDISCRIAVPIPRPHAASIWLKGTWSRNILCRLRSNCRAIMIRATLVPCLAWARSKAGR